MDVNLARRRAGGRLDGFAAMRRFAPLIASLISILLTLGVCEIGARYLADPTDGFANVVAFTAEARASSVLMKSADPELLYVTRPNYVRNGVRISEAHGVLRADDVEMVRPAGTFRVAIIGDSIAAGHPFRSGPIQPFGPQLESLLNTPAASPRIEVLTFAADGYGTLQEARLLETHVTPFSPDVVIIAYCLNDPTESYTPAVWFVDDPAPRSYLLDFVKRRLRLTPSELSPAHPRYTNGAIDWNELYRADGEDWSNVERGFTRIEAFARVYHAPVLLTLFPLLLDGTEPSALKAEVERIYTQVQMSARGHGFHVLNLADVFLGRPPSEMRFRQDDPIHPSAAGHTLAAQAIRMALEKDKLIPR